MSPPSVPAIRDVLSHDEETHRADRTPPPMFCWPPGYPTLRLRVHPAARDTHRASEGRKGRAAGADAVREMSVPRRNLEHMSEHAATPAVEPVSGLPAGLAAELAELPPGPGLAAALARVDRGGLPGYDMVIVLRARSRQLAY